LSATIGSKLGLYEITALLGKGGMGEVYRARDTKLKRDVAIKTLPDEFSHDVDRLSRLQREAEVLASLNHPNIAAIYDFQEADGARFLVLELVEGETLADRIARGPIPIDEALLIAKSICEALEAAHEQGIVHRDLKPANVKITPDGRVKVLDFGLAKAMEQSPATPLSNSPTLISMAASNAGVILGTAAYMSPEQASGKAVDKRTDLWAFGVVLLEMLTARPVFEGETVSHVLAAVLMKDPDWNALPARTPAPIRKLLRRCLEKDRKRRLDSAAAARLEIEEALAVPTAEVTPASTGRLASSSQVAWIIAMVAVLVAVGLAVVHFHEAPPTTPPETQLDIVTPPTSDLVSFALSPDGKQIVYVASGDGVSRLWLRPLASATAQPLTGTEGASYPFWSPDSKSIGFFAGGQLKRLDIGAGPPQVLATASNGRGGAWNADGIILFAPSGGSTAASQLFRVAATGGGEPIPVTKLDPQALHRLPYFLPGGRQFLFFAVGSPDTQGIYLGSLDSKETTRLTFSDTGAAYLPTGWLAWMQAGTLRVRRLDVEGRKLVGDPVTLADQVVFDPGTFSGAFSVSGTGMVAYRTGVAGGRRQLAWFDRMGKPLGLLGEPDENGMLAPRISPDGRRVAVWRIVQGNADIWLLDGVRTNRFTSDAALDRFSTWSPDGSRIVFDSTRKGAANLYIKPAGGAGAEELLLDSAQDKFAADWSRDGRFLLFVSIDPQSGMDIWVLPLNGDRKPWVFLKTNFDEIPCQFSPDGRWVAYMSNESGQFEIYIRPFVEGGSGTDQWRVSTAGGICGAWRPDGKELYYTAPDGKMMAALIYVRGAQLEPGPPVALFQTRMVGGGVNVGLGRQWDVSRDGHFLINTIPEEAAAYHITLLQNWHPIP
jgi:serine/threonine protein kinase